MARRAWQVLPIALALLNWGCKQDTGTSDKKAAAAPVKQVHGEEAQASAEGALGAKRLATKKPKTEPPKKRGGAPAPKDVAAPPPNAERTDSGLATVVLRPGTGKRHPKPNDLITMHYVGWLQSSGEMYHSTHGRHIPTPFQLKQAAPGWVEALGLMVEGEKRRLWLPKELAQHEVPRPQDPKEAVTVDVELLTIADGPPSPSK